jgi:hypothetical protein
VGSRRRFDTSPKRIPACAARGAVLVCSACVSLIISSANPFALPSPRGRHSSFFIHPSAAPGATGQQLSTHHAREKTAGGREVENPPPPSTIGFSSVADPVGRHHRARPACHGSVTREETSRCRQRSLFSTFPSGSCPPFPVSCSVYALVRLVIAGGFSHVDAPGQEEDEVVPSGCLRAPSEFRVASSARRWIRWCDRFVQEIPAKRSVALLPFQLCSVYGTTLGGCLMFCLRGVFYPLLRVFPSTSYGSEDPSVSRTDKDLLSFLREMRGHAA